MIRYDALPDDTAFNADPELAQVRAELAMIYGQAPAFVKDEDRIEFPEKILGKPSDHWRKYKGAFAAVQGGRCGFCELPVIGGQPGDVEHYRPKARVQILNPDHQGKEVANLSNVMGRKALRTIGTGYWWDAYNWENYLLSCTICNRTWKGNYFPTTCPTATRKRPAQGNPEVELLLHPFGDEDPGDHLAYDLDGRIRGLTPQGLATIETVGLWRPSLVIKRKPVLTTLHRLINEMKTGSAEIRRSHALTIAADGAADALAFPGMVRIYFRQEARMSWTELEALLPTPPNSG